MLSRTHNVTRDDPNVQNVQIVSAFDSCECVMGQLLRRYQRRYRRQQRPTVWSANVTNIHLIAGYVFQLFTCSRGRIKPVTNRTGKAFKAREDVWRVLKQNIAGPILSVFFALIVHSELKSVHPGFPLAFIFLSTS